MKKTSKIIALLFSLFLCLSAAFALGCGNLDPKAETVTRSMNGVYSVFKESKGYTAYSDDDAKVKLVKSYLVKDKTSSAVGYDFSSAPLAQFSLLKTAYEKIGKNFKFGKTYAATVSGSVGYDFYNLTKSDASENSVPFEAEVLLKIDVTAENTVTAEIGLAYYYNRQTINERRQCLYTEFTIETDKTDDKTFTFTAYTVNDSSAIDEDGKYVTYAYDYYKASGGKTQTKRHFYVTSPSLIIINDTIDPSYYLDDDDFSFVTGAEIYEAGFTSRSYHTDPKSDDEIGYTQIKNALFKSICMDFKCNSAMISYSSLFGSISNAITDNALKTAYSDTAKIVGQDLAYNMLPSRTYDYGDISVAVKAVKVMDEDGTEVSDITISKDMTIIQLDTTLSSHVYCIYDINGAEVREKADLTAFDISVNFSVSKLAHDGHESVRESEYVPVLRSDNVSAAFIAAGVYDTNTVNVKFSLLPSKTVSVIWKVTVTGDAEKAVNELFPSGFIYNAVGVNLPEITASSTEYFYNMQSGVASVYAMSFEAETLLKDYASLLEYNGYIKQSEKLFTQEFMSQNKKITVSLALNGDDPTVEEHCLLIKISCEQLS